MTLPAYASEIKDGTVIASLLLCKDIKDSE